jgi:hypothetical protein
MHVSGLLGRDEAAAAGVLSTGKLKISFDVEPTGRVALLPAQKSFRVVLRQI